MAFTVLTNVRAVGAGLIWLVLSSSLVYAAAPPNDPHFTARGSWGRILMTSGH